MVLERALQSQRSLIGVVLGTRPEAIKLGPVIRALCSRPREARVRVIATGQHRELLEQVLSRFEILPDLDLGLMQDRQTLGGLTSRALAKLEGVLEEERLDLVVVQGDTTTAFAAALAAFYQRVPVAHVEAGLRSGDPYDPFPEEVNRRLVAALASVHLAPTPRARDRLLNEGIDPSRVAVTGNTVGDALDLLRASGNPNPAPGVQEVLAASGRLVLVTSHRRETWGEPLESICLALRDLVDRNAGVRLVFPVHPNPQVRETVDRLLAGRRRVHLLPPIDYPNLLDLLARVDLVLTDSGGIQEEAPSFGKPVLVLRETTERPEAIDAGMALLVGTSRARIVPETERLLSDPVAYEAMAGDENPFGDGRAAERVAEALMRFLGARSPLLEPEREFRQLQRREVVG